MAHGAQDYVSNAVTGAVYLTVPIGGINVWSAAAMPIGWLECNGQVVSRSQYSLLFAVIGTTFGVGNGSTTFNLPNISGNVPMGLNAEALGLQGGEETHALTVNEMPAHTHSYGSGTVYNGGNYLTGNGTTDTSYSGPAVKCSDSVTPAQGLPHNNIMPYLTIKFIIYAGAV